jgi:hypothetical protein
MAKKQVTKRSVRPKKIHQQEPVTQAVTAAESKADIPTGTPAATQASSAPQPSLWRDKLMIFALTLVGTLAGVWIGSSLTTRTTQNTQPDGRVQTSDARIEKERRQTREILVAIQEELVENARILKQRTAPGQVAMRNAGSSFQVLKDDFWTALVYNSEIRWATDPQLLRDISNAYYYIDEIKSLERKNAGGKGSQKNILEISATAEKAIVDAAVEIDQKLVSTAGK